MDEFFEDVRSFWPRSSVANIFGIARPKSLASLFYTRGRGCKAKGFYNSSGIFTVMKGSVVAASAVPIASLKAEAGESPRRIYDGPGRSKLVMDFRQGVSRARVRLADFVSVKQ